MPEGNVLTKKVPTYCALCTSRCGAIATVEEGRLTKLSADPSHPTGQALCIKGKVAPELIYSPDRLLHPVKRTKPKGNDDAGWERVSWDEALSTIAARLNALRSAHGAETVAFNSASPSTSALVDSRHWVQRLRRAFGSPNQAVSFELCGWGRYMANIYSYGTALPASVMPDLDNAGCILFWGYNPSASRIAHATATVAAMNRGAKLVFVDPRNVGLAHRADEWLQVRPGADGALALGLSHVMIENEWYDDDFLRTWTNAPFLVREDTGRLLRVGDAGLVGPGDAYVSWAEGPVPARPGVAQGDTALLGQMDVETEGGPVRCRTVFQIWREMCARYDPATVEDLTGIPAQQVERTATLLWQSRPVGYMTWSGLEQLSNATQIARAIGLLYALTGNYDQRGGNLELPAVPTADVTGGEFLPQDQRTKTLGLDRRPLGSARFDEIISADLYRAILDHDPYPVRGLVSFGSNLILAHADGEVAAKALEALDFHVHVDHFINPSAQFADIVLPAATPFETEGLKIGFEISEEACSLVQLRKPLVAAEGESRSDTAIVFDLAVRLGLGDRFWDGNVDEGLRAMLEPSGLTLEDLRAAPNGKRVPLRTKYRKFAEITEDTPRGFNTPSGRIEFFSETLLEHGYPPLPDYEEPLISHHSRPDLKTRFPLILTCAKDTLYCESQHRNLPSLRRRAPDPVVDLHPKAAEDREIKEGDWVRILTPHAAIRARARLTPDLDPNVVCGQHGWWQGCAELNAPEFPATGPHTANYNLLIGHDAVDPMSGSVPLRAYVCELAPE